LGTRRPQAFLAFGDALDISTYATCTDVIDGDLSASLLLTDGVDLLRSAIAKVDTSVPGTTAWTLACTDSDGNATTAPFRVHVGFAEAVEALRGFARTASHSLPLRTVVENADFFTAFEVCPTATTAERMAVAWCVRIMAWVVNIIHFLVFAS
jgi:hypothetical protein